ncbi:MAG: 1,4-alpha-glucan branching protein domain-containing protein [Candidatus Sericytochromatia bacterium]|nr:1,4-alpha-glucan branching protein domain-containing protein [Candidatus Sericytochromatia bacterium]
MAVGTFSLVLHSHLPYYRKAGMWPFGEENLYEAMAETYLPLLRAVDELLAEGIAPKLTIGITPVLAEQLADAHLKQGFERYVEDILVRIERDVQRYSPEGELESARWRAGERRAQKLEQARLAWLAEQEAAIADATGTADHGPLLRSLKSRRFARTLVAGLPLATLQHLTFERPAKLVRLVATAEQAGAEAAARAGARETAEPLPAALKASLEPTLADIPEEPLDLPAEADPRRELSQWYLDWYRERLSDFRERYHGDLLGAFRRLQEAGAIELITCAATHGFSPLFSRDSTLHAQFATAVQTHQRHFGAAPLGVWLPECAYRPGYEDERDYRPPVEQFLAEHGLAYFFTDAHAVVGGKTSGYRRHIGLYGNIEYLEMPERPLSGLDTFHGYWLPDHPVAFYARNERAGWQVWSADMGYPGDPGYREFHKRDGNSGMCYWRITGARCDLADKAFYDPQHAAERVAEHSDHYVGLIHDMLKGYHDANGEVGHVVVPFDTELFGHWWFEGIDWIKAVLRKMALHPGIRPITVGELHRSNPPAHAFQLPESTWGAGGHYHVWMNPQVEWMWPIIHRCERRMEELVRTYPVPPSPFHARALAQAAREVLLLEGSDWPFLVTTGQARTYAIDRFNEHVARFDALADALMADQVTDGLVSACEDIDNLFPDIDYRLFASRQERVGLTR